MHLKNMNKVRVVKIIGLLFSVLVIIVAIDIALTSPEQNHQDIAAKLASGCPQTYENDLLEFQYPCNWLLTSENDDGTLIFTDFSQGGSYQNLYFFIAQPKDGFSDLNSAEPGVCESGESYSERIVTIPSLDGQMLEACYREDHEGLTITVPSDRSETGYVSISVMEYSSVAVLESIIVPSLKVK